jgi:hypothetical protein
MNPAGNAIFALVLLAGCATAPVKPAKPALLNPPALPVQMTPLSAVESAAASVAMASHPVRTYVAEAFWPAWAGTAYGFFQTSPDLTNWQTVFTFDYPTNGAWVSWTNVTKAPVIFYRAGTHAQ